MNENPLQEALVKLDPARERALVAAALRDVAWARFLVSELGAMRFEDPACRRIFEVIAAVLARGEVPSFAIVEEELLRSPPVGLPPIVDEPVVAATARLLGGVPTGWALPGEHAAGDAALDALRNVPRVPTGIVELDRLLQGGLRAGDLVLVASWPTSGGSWLALDIARRVALESTRHVLVFSPLVREEDLRARLIATTADVERERVLVAGMDDEESERIRLAAARLVPLRIDDDVRLDMEAIDDRLRSAARGSGVSLCVVADAEQLWQTRAPCAALDDLRALARELSVPIIAVVRLVESEDGASDPARGGRTCELPQDGEAYRHADVVVLVDRPESWITRQEVLDRDLGGVVSVVVLSEGVQDSAQFRV